MNHHNNRQFISSISKPIPLIAPDRMSLVDRACIASGIPGIALMEAAAHAVCAEVLRHFDGCRRVAVLAGPGNNGGDGFAVARLLNELGMPVQLYALDPGKILAGDAAIMAERYAGDVKALSRFDPSPGDLIVDALFGAGLDRPVGPDVIACIERVDRHRLPVISVDLPSGLSGQSGEILGAAFSATATVSFAALKPGHLLASGRALCGALKLADIGIPERYVSANQDELFVNGPAIWRPHIPRLSAASHKYQRGHLTVFSGGVGSTGAARLSAAAALKSGAGLVTLAVPPSAVLPAATQVTSIMIQAISDAHSVEALVADQRRSTFVIGPGFGVGERLRDYLRVLCSNRSSLVLDADALSSFAGRRNELRDWVMGRQSQAVITPHMGEFERLFPELEDEQRTSKIEKARYAAQELAMTVVLKGADTVIAAPDGRALVNANAPPQLATAGSGDVLAGAIGGLLTAGVAPFEAAAMGVWLHGEAGQAAGAGLTADDLPDLLGAAFGLLAD